MKFGFDTWLSAKEYDELPQDDLLQCRVIEWRVVDHECKWLAVLLPWNNCTSMDGVIKRAQQHTPGVRAISTINQLGLDTFYWVGPDNKWHASRQGPKPPEFADAPYSWDKD